MKKYYPLQLSIAVCIIFTTATGFVSIPQASQKFRVSSASTFQSHRLIRGKKDENTKGKIERTKLFGEINVVNGNADYKNLKPQVYTQRWVQLAYLSALALLSDWICFSVAAAPSTFENAYVGHSAASLIDVFLFTNVISCFLVTDTVRRFGLEFAIKGASVLMAAGCLFRSGTGFIGPIISSLGLSSINDGSLANTGLVPYWSLLTGTILVGISQPFFQCTPPLLSAKWFASDERATSTAVALNFNQIGIATAFLVGGGMATNTEGLASYFGVISVACIIVTLGTLLQFQNEPPTPPSTSEIEKLVKGEQEPPFIDSVRQLFSNPGFFKPMASFIMSLSITNVVGAFIDEVMERGGVTNQLGIDLAGAGFEFGILFGGIVIGGYVDRTKKYKDVTMALFVASMMLLVPLGLTEHAIGKEPALLIAALIGLGVAAGPIQPINAELAVDISYPCDETAVESVQQIGGNLVSALLVPIVEIASRQDYQILPGIPKLSSDIRGDVVMLIIMTLVTSTYFSSFDCQLKRSMADDEDADAALDVITPENTTVKINGESSLSEKKVPFWERKGR